MSSSASEFPDEYPGNQPDLDYAEHTNPYDEAADEKSALLAALTFMTKAESRRGADRARFMAKAREQYIGGLRNIAVRNLVGVVDVEQDEEPQPPEAAVKSNTMELENSFLRTFWLGGKRAARDRKGSELIVEIEELRQQAKEIKVQEDDLPQIPQHKRLTVISNDPRAGFFPKNTHSLNRVMAWLDYDDAGIEDQLKEVFTHTQKTPPGSGRHRSAKHAVRTIESMAWEVGDDAIEAKLRLVALADLKQKLLGVSPTASLYDEFCRHTKDESSASIGELFGNDALGLMAFTQYLDLVEFKDKAIVKGLDLPGKLSPLTSTEDPPRTKRPTDNPNPGKRKVVMNQYVRSDTPEVFKRHIIDRLKSTTVKDFHKQADNCIEDLSAEVRFHGARLAEFEDFRHGPSEHIQGAVAHIKRQLEELEPARV